MNPAKEKLKILKHQNKFLFELTEEERKAAELLKSYIEGQCRDTEDI